LKELKAFRSIKHRRQEVQSSLELDASYGAESLAEGMDEPELLFWITGLQRQEVSGDMWIEVMDTQVSWSSKAI
jgi:hypothetical protein